MEKKNISYRLTFENTSDKFIIVGNLSVVLSFHDTLQDANEAFDRLPNVTEMPFGSLYVMAPGDIKVLDTITYVDQEWERPKKEKIDYNDYDFSID